MEVLVKMYVMVMFMFAPSPLTVRGAGGDGHAVYGRLSAQVSGSATIASVVAGRRNALAPETSGNAGEICARVTINNCGPRARGATPVGRRLQ